MSRRADLATLALAVVVHLGFAIAIAREHVGKRPASSTVELEFPKQLPPIPDARPAAPAGPPHAAAAPKTRRQLALRTRPTATSHHPASAAAAPAAAAPPPLAPAPQRPVFGVSMASTSVVAVGAAVPAGSTTAAQPAGPGGGAPSGDGEGHYQPASESDVATMPEVDTDACGKSITYPDEAEQAGIEGDVRLRVGLTPEGHVYTVRVLSGLGHGLDRAAIEALKHRCRFSPAMDKSGKPVAFVIQSYMFHFQLPR